MAFSKVRSMTPFSLSSVSIVSSVTCFISCWNFWGVSLLRMLRTRLNSSCVLMFSGSFSSGSSVGRGRVFFAEGFQAFSALFSCTSSLSDMLVMIFLGSFLWICWERRVPPTPIPMPGGWRREKDTYWFNTWKSRTEIWGPFRKVDLLGLCFLLPCQVCRGWQRMVWSLAHSSSLVDGWGRVDAEESYLPEKTGIVKYLHFEGQEKTEMPSVWDVLRSCTLSRTTSLMAGSPSGLFMLAEMNWKPRRNSLSYFFFSSGLIGFHCSERGNQQNPGHYFHVSTTISWYTFLFFFFKSTWNEKQCSPHSWRSTQINILRSHIMNMTNVF